MVSSADQVLVAIVKILNGRTGRNSGTLLQFGGLTDRGCILSQLSKALFSVCAPNAEKRLPKEPLADGFAQAASRAAIRLKVVAMMSTVNLRSSPSP